VPLDQERKFVPFKPVIKNETVGHQINKRMTIPSKHSLKLKAPSTMDNILTIQMATLKNIDDPKKIVDTKKELPSSSPFKISPEFYEEKIPGFDNTNRKSSKKIKEISKRLLPSNYQSSALEQCNIYFKSQKF
jgi:hypothetical protein